MFLNPAQPCGQCRSAVPYDKKLRSQVRRSVQLARLIHVRG